MRILFLFLDGVGLGEADPAVNPFAAAELPMWRALLNGHRPLAGVPRQESARAIFVPTDPNLGVAGPPQSATGQATILTGLNVPARLGKHYGPKPNGEIAALLQQGNVFKAVAGRFGPASAALLNAYPQRYFDAIGSGRRSYSAIPLAVTSAGLPLFTAADLAAGRGLSADFTGAGWPEPGAPVFSPRQAGRRLAELAAGYRFAFFEHWITDYLGHRGTLEEGRQLLEQFDLVLAGLLEAWDDSAGLIVITADHGNLEDLRHRHHTRNQVPTLVIGEARAEFAAGLTDLTHIAPAVLRLLES